MPVSRKRKKKSGRSGRPSRPRASANAVVEAGGRDHGGASDALRDLFASSKQAEAQRASRAARMARGLVAELVTAAQRPDTYVDDALCAAVGPLLVTAAQAPVDQWVGPDRLAEALVAAAEAAVVAALPRSYTQSMTLEGAGAWCSPWRVLATLASVLPRPLDEVVDEAIGRSREARGGQVLPSTPPGPAAAGPVLWTSDGYGSRFAVVAPIAQADRPVRWYLWDIDACGHEAFTVHSGFYRTPEAALAAWQAGVGAVAAAGTVLDPVNDPWLLAALLPADPPLVRTGGETAEQFAEYHRSRRLGEVVRQAVPAGGTRPVGGLDAAAAAVEFVDWLRGRCTGERTLSMELDELAGELADSWCLNGIESIYATCSPHRVALCVLHIRNYYVADFADQLLALLPEWTRWLAARNGTPPELADRCLPYAHGQPNLLVGEDDSRPHYLARVVE